jgi:hypothetical protein
MHPKISPLISPVWRSVGSLLAATDDGRHRTVARPRLELLERRVNLSTYIWTALGDGQTWNDANNWQLVGAPPFIQPPTVPTPNSNVVFPPIASLPPGSSSTINFNFAFLNMPLNSLTIEDSYTFSGNPIKIDSSLSVASPFTNAPNWPTATFLLAGLQLGPGVVISTGTGATLQLANASDPTGLPVTVQGPVTKSGGGQLVVLGSTAITAVYSQTKYILVATVTGGNTALTPTGTVVFRKNGRSFGSARLKGGVARLVLGRKAPGSQAKFVASFQKNSRFRSSSSPPFEFVS